MLDPAYRWDSVQNVPSSATTKFQGPIYTATPYKSKVKKSQFSTGGGGGIPLRAEINVGNIGRFNVVNIGAVDFDEPFSDVPTLRDSHAA